MLPRPSFHRFRDAQRRMPPPMSGPARRPLTRISDRAIPAQRELPSFGLDPESRPQYLAWLAGNLYRRGRFDLALSKIAEAMPLARDSAVRASLERLERQIHLRR